MQTPEFFDRVPAVTLIDPLSELLGASVGGEVSYGYGDVVKLAGHSCPTVTGAYLMALKGLAALYGGATPRRGEISVQMREAKDSGTTGVIAQVLTLITGAVSTSP